VRYAGRVAAHWRIDLRKTFLALAAMIAAAACTDATAPDATPQVNALLKSDLKTKPTASASTVAPSSLWSGYSSQSHHWSHITTMMTDFYYSWTTTERAWAGAHYDLAMSGNGSEWRAANPTIGHMTYALLWTTQYGTSGSLATSYVSDMTTWFHAHTQYSMEKAFVHKRGTSITAANRASYNHWGTNRWIMNPADPGCIAYTASRIQRLISSDGGVFFDEASSGDMKAHLGSLLEYSSNDLYVAAVPKVLTAIKGAVGSKTVMLNLAEYTTPLDSLMARAAGAIQTEMFNNFKYSGMAPRWQWINNMNAVGVLVDFVSAYGTQDMAGMTYYPRGNSATNTQRAKLWEIASYYMAVSSNPKLLALQLENAWAKPYSSLWMKAQEANIGHPTGGRYQHSSGTDPYGNRYIVYRRDFDRAMVLLRLQQGWGSQTYTDGTAITITLPAGERWIPLNADGTVGSAITSIRLRNSEAAILLKGSTM